MVGMVLVGMVMVGVVLVGMVLQGRALLLDQEQLPPRQGTPRLAAAAALLLLRTTPTAQARRCGGVCTSHV